MNGNDTYEQEIDLKDLLFAVLYKWRMILAAAVVLAVVLGGYKALTSYRAMVNPAARAEAERIYQTDLETYELDKELYGQEIDNLLKQQEDQQKYLDESVFININPYDVWEATSAWFVRTDYMIMPDKTYQNVDYTETILQAYNLALSSTEFMESVAKDIGIDVRYLGEVVTITGENSLLKIQVKYTDEENARKIIQEFSDGVESLHGRIAGSIGDHVMSEVSSSVGSVVDLELAESQNLQKTNLDQMTAAVKEKQKQLADLKAPVMAQPSMSSALKDGIKYAALGGVLGAFMVVFFVCVVFLMSDKLYSAKQLKTYCGVKIIGTLPEVGRKGMGAVNKWLRRLEGRASAGSEETEYGLIAANVSNYSAGLKSLIVAGAAAEEKVKEVAKRLSQALPQVQIVAEGNLLQDSGVLKKLPECDGVVLVEGCGSSTYGDVKLEIEKIGDLKKQVIGCVVFE